MTFKQALRRARLLRRNGDSIGAIKWLALTLARASRPVSVNIRGERIALRPGTTDLGVLIGNLSGEFDEVIAKVPTAKHGLIIDAGGFLGGAAISFAKAYPDATVVTLEPSPDNFALLKKNIAPYANIRAMNKAVGSKAGAIELKDRGTGFSGLTVVGAPEDNPASQDIATVERTTIPAIIQEFGGGGVDIVKIDIEGGEHDLLSADTGWLAQSSAVCIELHDRIVSGCSDAWEQATAGRINTKLDGEKFLSVRA